MKYNVTVQADTACSKVFQVEADHLPEAEEKAIEAAENKINEGDGLADWHDLGTDFEIFAATEEKSDE